MNVRRFPIVFTVLALGAALPGRAAEGGLLFTDVVLAKGQGVEVRRSHLDDAFIARQAALVAAGQGIREAERLHEEALLLDQLIVVQLLVNKATAADKLKAKEKSDKMLESSAKAAGSEEAFYRELKARGIKPQQFTNQIVDQAIGDELLTREVKGLITVTPEQVQHFYETNDAPFRQPELARAGHILFATRDLRTRLELSEEQRRAKRDKAEKVLARAKKGEDFNKLIQECSEDPLMAQNKGEYRFTRAKDDPRQAMLVELETAAFALKPGEVSDLIRTDLGFHILKLIEITPARKQPYSEVSDRIRDHLLGREAALRMPAYFAKLRKEAGVEILDERLKEAWEKAEQELKK
jgi:parvulin-like peptidyl-prolyl isomerase